MNHSTQFDRFDNAEIAAGALVGLMARAGRDIAVHTRNLEPAIWEHPAVIAATRAYITDRAQCNIRILVGEPAALTMGNTHFMALAQRMPSHLQFRQPDPDEAQMEFDAVVSDRNGVMKWDIGTGLHGEYAFDAPARAQSLMLQFNRIWDRARGCSEFRPLGI